MPAYSVNTVVCSWVLAAWYGLCRRIFVNEFTGKGVYGDNFSVHFPGIIDGCFCAASGDFPADRQKNVCMVDHEFVALHHTSFVVISADVNNGIRLLQDRAMDIF